VHIQRDAICFQLLFQRIEPQQGKGLFAQY
jgi:hypothetical protein